MYVEICYIFSGYSTYSLAMLRPAPRSSSPQQAAFAALLPNTMKPVLHVLAVPIQDNMKSDQTRAIPPIVRFIDMCRHFGKHFGEEHVRSRLSMIRHKSKMLDE